MERIACHAALAGRRLVTVQFSEQSLTRLYDGLPPFHSPIAPGSFPFIFVAPRVANAQQVDSAALCVQLHPHHHRSTYKQRCTTKHFTLKYLEKKSRNFTTLSASIRIVRALLNYDKFVACGREEKGRGSTNFELLLETATNTLPQKSSLICIVQSLT